MKNARVMYFGEGKLSLQMRRLPPNKEVTCRLDDILPPERRRYRDALLVVGMDGRLINIGARVPRVEAERVIAENPVIEDNYSGFYVEPPSGYGIQSKKETLVVLPASKMAEEAAKKAQEPAPESEPKEEVKPAPAPEPTQDAPAKKRGRKKADAADKTKEEESVESLMESL